MKDWVVQPKGGAQEAAHGATNVWTEPRARVRVPPLHFRCWLGDPARRVGRPDGFPHFLRFSRDRSHQLADRATYLLVTATSSKKDPKLSLEEEQRTRVDKSRHIAQLAGQAGMEKKAIGVEIIDVVGKVDYADFLVLMTGTSDRHVAAIARGVDEDLSKAGHHPMAIEGRGGSAGQGSGEWVLLDFFDVVVHVFSEDARGLYDISGLWLDAKRLEVPAKPIQAPSRSGGSNGDAS